MVATSCRRGTLRQRDRLVRQQRGAQLGQRRVLGAGNAHFAVQLPAPADQELVHECVQLAWAAAHSAGVNALIESACTSSVFILSPSVA